MFKEGKYSDAIDKYSLAIEICPEEAKLDKATYHQNKAAAYEKQVGINSFYFYSDIFVITFNKWIFLEKLGSSY